jgi:hypothetical protein
MDQEERIREYAHRIWEEEGRPEGREREHWERACREIGGASARAKGVTSPGSSGLVGADDAGSPGTMGVDDLNVAGRLSDPSDSRPTTGRSKLVGS